MGASEENDQQKSVPKEEEFDQIRKFRTCRSDPDRPGKLICKERITRSNSKTGLEEIEELSDTRDIPETQNKGFNEFLPPFGWSSPFSNIPEKEAVLPETKSFLRRFFGLPMFSKQSQENSQNIPENSRIDQQYLDDDFFIENIEDVEKVFKRINRVISPLHFFGLFDNPYYHEVPQFYPRQCCGHCQNHCRPFEYSQYMENQETKR